MNIPKSYTRFRILMGTLVIFIGIGVAVPLTLLAVQLIQK